MARYFRLPFADSGDKDTIPDETATSIVSYATGYTQDYQRNPASDPLARRPERNFFNQLMFDITDTLRQLYETGTVPFITSAMNNGSAFSYPVGARVILSNRIYENTTANNTTTPPAAGWVLVDVSGGDARYLLESNNLSDLTNAANARNNIGLGTAATVNTGTGSSNVPTTGQSDLRYLQESLNLSDLSSLSTARTNLGLGTSATLDQGTDVGDLMEVGAFGLGGELTFISDFNIPVSDRETKFLAFSSAALNKPPPTQGTIINLVRTDRDNDVLQKTQLVTGNDGNTYTRVLSFNTWTPWREVLTNTFTWGSPEISFSNGLGIPNRAIGAYIQFTGTSGNTSSVFQRLPGSSTDRILLRFRDTVGDTFIGSFCMFESTGGTMIINGGNGHVLRWLYSA